MLGETVLKILGIPFGLDELILFGASLVLSLVLGVFVSWYFFRRSQRVKRISYEVRSELLLGRESQNLPADIVVHYRGRPIQQLNRILVMFWNSGNDLIREGGRIAADELRISLDATRVLDASVRKVRRDGSNIRVVTRDDSIGVRFDFLDRGDGALIEVLYSGYIEKPELKGSFQGMYRPLDKRGQLKKWKRYGYVTDLIQGLVYSVLGLSLLVDLAIHHKKGGFQIVFVGVFGILSAVLGLLQLTTALDKARHYPLDLEDPSVM